MTPERTTGGERDRTYASHHEVADVLRGRIKSGDLRPGQRMPTQAALAREFGVERGAVRRALRILRDERLLVDAVQGSPATVATASSGAPARGPEARPRPTTVTLAPRIAASFAAPHVRIDALCRTAASLTLGIGEALRQIHAGRLRPARVDVRVLLPSRDIDLAFPSPVDATGAGADGVLHRRWLAQRNAQGQVLRHNLRSLRATHGIEVDVAFRALPFTPPVKLYLLNGDEALFAYYTLERRGEQIDQEYLETWDAQGAQSTLFPFEQSAGPRDRAFVEESQLWFNALWNTISSDLKLNG